MTPEERARQVVADQSWQIEAYYTSEEGEERLGRSLCEDTLASLIADAIRAAVRAEREALLSAYRVTDLPQR